jgi:carbamoyl-phosphate synthase large subunit
MINILITGAGGGIAQGVIKSLKMITDLEIKIIAADINEFATGLYAADLAYIIERCNSDNYLESLEAIFTKESIDFYIPGTDIELKFCAINKQLIKDKYDVHTIISSPEVIEISENKLKTSLFLKKNNFSYPKTEYLKNVHTESINYPVIIKPSAGFGSIGVYKVNNYDELIPHLKNTHNIIMQDYIGSKNNEYTCTVVKIHDKLSPVIALKRVLRSGDTYRAEPIQSEKIEQYIFNIASILNIDGGCNFQLRLDNHGEPVIFEINSRFSGTTPFCSQIGFNPLEFYLKNYFNIKYEANIKYNSVVLRFWSEVIVEKSTVNELSIKSKIKPSIVSQFKLFK